MGLVAAPPPDSSWLGPPAVLGGDVSAGASDGLLSSSPTSLKCFHGVPPHKAFVPTDRAALWKNVGGAAPLDGSSHACLLRAPLSWEQSGHQLLLTWGPSPWEGTGQASVVHRAGLGGTQGRDPHHPVPTAPQFRAFLQPPMKGVVMETFGSGNGPGKPDLLQELRVATGQGLVIVNCTHCLQGSVTSDYASGMAMVGAGVSAFNVTSEAALARLLYVLGQPGLSLDDRVE
ncbi:hypothetical protein P7K49_018705, partial [Saguinus oedipus]